MSDQRRTTKTPARSKHMDNCEHCGGDEYVEFRDPDVGEMPCPSCQPDEAYEYAFALTVMAADQRAGHDCDDGSLHLPKPTDGDPYPEFVIEKPARWGATVPCPKCYPSAARGALQTNTSDALRAGA